MRCFQSAFGFFDHGSSTRIENTGPAIKSWLGSLRDRRPFVVLEATGRYDAALVFALEQATLPYARVNPARARAFAKATGQLAKTDAVDARGLARMGQSLDLQATSPKDKARQTLEALHRRRSQLVTMRKQEKQRLGEALPGERPSLVSHIAWLDQEIAKVEKRLQTALSQSPALARQEKLLRSIPGIGPVTALALMTLLPELGHCSPKNLAALVGLAPFNADSGIFRGKRSIRGGRKPVRDALYMAAVTAARSSSRYKAFAQGLEKREKPFKVRTIAVARKLLITANAVVRDQTPYAA